MPPGMQQQIAQMQQNGGMGGMQEMMRNMMGGGGGGGDMPDMEEMQRKPSIDPPKTSNSVSSPRNDGTNGWHARYGRYGEYAREDDGCYGWSINRNLDTTLFTSPIQVEQTLPYVIYFHFEIVGQVNELGKFYNYIISIDTYRPRDSEAPDTTSIILVHFFND